ncbi:MAG: metal ABC transporter permease [Candidatus Cloacimonetes bacterium]|nr:metal ABC transporter permease [Candidatus Cloacimonadota bacterium]
MALLQYEFIRNAVYAAFLASISCGIIGSYVIVKRISTISGGIAHAAFGGLGLGYFLGVNPVWGIIPFGLASALSIGYLSRKSRMSEDTLIGIVWACGMALGVLFIGLTPGYIPDLFSYLFGNILTVPAGDLLLMILLDIIIITFTLLFFKEFLALCYDEEYARVTGVPVMTLYLLLLCMVALTVVMLIRIVGIILVIALLTIPASIARNFTSKLKYLMILSIVICFLLSLFGIWLSYLLDIPSGAAIILLSSLVLSLTLLIKKINFFVSTRMIRHK